MKQKYFILAFMFLCILCGQGSYALSSGESNIDEYGDYNHDGIPDIEQLDDVVITGPGNSGSCMTCDWDPFFCASPPCTDCSCDASFCQTEYDPCLFNPALCEPGGSPSGPPVDIVLPPDNAISDIKKFLECFSISSPANLTVYAERMGGGNGVGHAFIGISQGNNSAVYGYYPKTTLGTLSGQGIMGENGEHNYDVSASITITGAQLNQIIALSQVYQSNWYDLSFNNCSDFATDVLNIAGVSTSGWIDTPNTVADILSGLANHTTVSNNAPKTNKSCP